MTFDVVDNLKKAPIVWCLLDEKDKELDTDPNLSALMSRNRDIQKYSVSVRVETTTTA